MLFPYTLPVLRDNCHARDSVQTGFLMISLYVRWSWQLVHFQLVTIDCSFTVTVANDTESRDSEEEHQILYLIIDS